MNISELKALQGELMQLQGELNPPLERFRAEFDFALRMAEAHPEQAAEWIPLLRQAAEKVIAGLKEGTVSVAALVEEAESILAPLGAAAKEYTIYCCGHAHIDMNWMWSWPETVSVCYDTFTTMDQLMDEFPAFHFSQSQASVYIAMQKYAPELFERIKQRVQEGRWEITASQWVEGDKNLASGEILARHLLYTRKYLKSAFGLPYEAIKIDWECDTFGHCWTLPGLLRQGGVTRYYHHRASGPRLQGMASGQMSQLFWWEGKDGRRVLAYDDSPNGYNCEINPRMTHLLFALERHTGLKDLLWVYGVGDHGGGPTRRHLRAAADMATWPIYPTVKLTTTDDYFSTVERKIEEQGLELPIHRDELNFVFEGCYTSESRIKFANRRGECDLVDTEWAAVLGEKMGIFAYPHEQLEDCWRRAMFIQFHDILPGSGIKETVEYAMGLFQENLAHTNSIRTRALRGIAGRIDTSALAPTCVTKGADLGLGAGVGNEAWWGGMSAVGAGECSADPFVIFNPAPFARDELVQVKVWNREFPDGEVVVRGADRTTVPAQILGRGHYWGHHFTVLAFPVRQLPALGWRAYVVDRSSAPLGEGACYVKETGRPVYGLGYVNAQMLTPVVMGNELIELQVSGEAGGIISLVDKRSGQELIGEDVLGAIDREQEAPHSMTAWQLGALVDSVRPLEGSVLQVLHKGPHLAAVQLAQKHQDSDYRLTISITAGSPQIDFHLDVNWLERGDPITGVPALRATFPLNIEDGVATFEIACGSIERPANGGECPALNWVDLTGRLMGGDQLVGATLLNDSKYGHQAYEDRLRLTLLRSSYDPDPLPEIGQHSIRYALVPHSGAFEVAQATQAGYAFNHPLVAASTTVHAGDLPAEQIVMEILTPNVMFSALKRSEDDSGLVLRFYEMEGRATRAQVRLADRLVGPEASAQQVDLLERPVEPNTATLRDGVLSFDIEPYSVVTVMLQDRA
ncbi:MAG: alpha-mannosidase [Candidatus Zipacnadales bacterium]